MYSHQLYNFQDGRKELYSFENEEDYKKSQNYVNNVISLISNVSRVRKHPNFKNYDKADKYLWRCRKVLIKIANSDTYYTDGIGAMYDEYDWEDAIKEFHKLPKELYYHNRKHIKNLVANFLEEFPEDI